MTLEWNSDIGKQLKIPAKHGRLYEPPPLTFWEKIKLGAMAIGLLLLLSALFALSVLCFFYAFKHL